MNYNLTQSKQIALLNNKKFQRWAEGKEKVIINQEDILLTEKLHIYAGYIGIKKSLASQKDRDIIDKTIIVKPLENGKYSLVMGLRHLKVARELNKPINCIIVGWKYDHAKLLKKIGMIDIDKDISFPNGTELVYPIKKIKIPPKFAFTKPNQFKFDKIKKYYLEKGCLDKPITVIQSKFDKQSVFLEDGYMRYLVLKNHGIKYIPVRFKAEKINKELEI